MNVRPVSLTVLGWVFVLFGSAAFLFGLLPLLGAAAAQSAGPRPLELGIAELSRLLAVVGGAGLLASRNWARGLLLTWMAYHVLIGRFHSAGEALVHGLLLAVLLYLLFRPQASAYFRAPRIATP